MSLLLSLAFSSAMASSPQRVSADFREVSNYKSFSKSIKFTPGQRAALLRNQFFVCPSKDESLYIAYGSNDYENLPSFVTVDNLLEIVHIFFDSTLRTAEQSRLLPDLESMTTTMSKQSLATLDGVKGTPLEAAARKNAAYFGVAATLLGQKPVLPEAVTTMVRAEVALIDAHSGFDKGGIFPYQFDYSQFVVRGHYSKSPQLGRYFRAMMWYGLVPFAVETVENGVHRPAKEQVEQALLISRDLETSGVAGKWQKLYDITSLFAGKANDATPPEWASLAKSTFGDNLQAYADAAKIQAFLAKIARLHPPLIVSKRSKGAVASAVQFRFMGQRAIPDSYVMQELSDPDKRPFPSPMDILSVLGSSRATALIDSNPAAFKTGSWPLYKPIRTQLAGQFASVSDEGWGRDFYWSWLNTLRPLLTPLPASAPAVLRSDAWLDKSLETALASWAELRHDTILYGLQSVAEMGDGDEAQPYTPGYIEPNVELYTRLGAMVDQMHSAMKSRGYLSAEAGDQFNGFSDLITFFKHVSERELAGQKLSKQEHWRIRKIEGDLEYLHNSIQLIGVEYKQLSQDDQFMALVADVHTAYGKALEVGVGCADHVVAILPIEGKLYLTRGAAFSYYEFLRPISERMTDEKWKAELRAGKDPARPFWVKSYFVNKPLDEKGG